MALSTTIAQKTFAGDGTSTVFTFPYKYISSDDLVVTLTNNTTGVVTAQTSADYTVTPVGSAVNGVYSSASITFNSAPSSSVTVTIYRDPALTQEFDFDAESDPLPVITRFADRTAMQLQNIDNRLDRAFASDLGDAFFDASVPDRTSASGGDLLALNADKSGLIWGSNVNGTTIASAILGVVQSSTIAAAFHLIAGGGRLYFPDAVGDGVADDTAALQACADALGAGDVMVLEAGATYSVTNFVLPSPTNTHIRNGLICIGGTATIKARSGGDTDYLVATKRWTTANVSSSGGSPWNVQNIIFDANSIAAVAFVDKSYESHHWRCQYHNATSAGVLHTRQNQDTTNGASSYLAECTWSDCHFLNNATYGFRSQGTNADDTDAPTDCFLIECTFDGNSVTDYNIYLANAAGWKLTGAHTYSSTTAGLYIKKMSRHGAIANNQFEDLVIIGDAGDYGFSEIGPSNFYWTGLRYDGADDTSTEVLRVFGSIFTRQADGVTKAQCTLNDNARSTKRLIGEANLFEHATPYARGGSSAGIIDVRGGYSSGGVGHLGWQLLDNGASAGPVLPLMRESASPAASDVIGRIEFNGRDSAGNAQTYAADETVITDPTSTSEDATRRFKQVIAGSEVTVLTLAPYLNQSVAGGSQVGLSASGEATTLIDLRRYSADASPATLLTYKARGTIASPSSIAQNDEVGRVTFGGYASSAFRDICYARAYVVAATPSSSDLEAYWTLFIPAASSATPTEIMRLRHSTGLSMYGANTVIDAARGIRFPIYTATNIADKTHAVNTANKAQGKAIYDSTNHRLMVADGATDVSNWYVADGSASVTPA